MRAKMLQGLPNHTTYFMDYPPVLGIESLALCSSPAQWMDFAHRVLLCLDGVASFWVGSQVLVIWPWLLYNGLHRYPEWLLVDVWINKHMDIRTNSYYSLAPQSALQVPILLPHMQSKNPNRIYYIVLVFALPIAKTIQIFSLLCLILPQNFLVSIYKIIC